MKTIKKETATVTTNTYSLELEGGRKVVYIEYLDEKGTVVDEILRDEDGTDICADDGSAELLEQIQKPLDDTEGA